MTMSSTFEGSDINSESIGHEENMYPTKLLSLHFKPSNR
jgi:hypothetical protein